VRGRTSIFSSGYGFKSSAFVLQAPELVGLLRYSDELLKKAKGHSGGVEADGDGAQRRDLGIT
jgi:hypothetical protein